MSATEVIAARWSELEEMDRAALRVAWATAFGEAAPHFLSMIFMRKALIWDAQSRRFGGIAPDLKRALKSTVGGKTVRDPAPAIRPGTQLVREWNGRRYHVEVTEEGFMMNGTCFKSLSAVALEITGTGWSGPRFFGLVKAAGDGA